MDDAANEGFLRCRVGPLGFSMDAPSNTLFALTFETNLKKTFSSSTYSLHRSLQEFDALFVFLCTEYPQHILPSPAFMSSDTTFLLRTTQTFLDTLTKHPLLRESEAVKTFVESEFQFAPPPSPQSSPSLRRKGINSSGLSFFTSIAASASSPTVKEVDSFFEKAFERVGARQAALTQLGKLNDRMGKMEMDGLKEVSLKMAGLVVDSKNTVGPKMKRVARIFQGWDDSEARLARYRSSSLNDELILSLRNLHSIQKALDYRLETLSAYDEACKCTQKRLAAIDKIRASSNIKQEKVDAAIESLAEAKKDEAIARETFRSATDTIREELTESERDLEKLIQEILDRYVTEQLILSQELYSLVSSIGGGS